MSAGRRRILGLESLFVFLCLAPGWCQRIETKIRLLEIAEVRGGVVSLEDLLPPQAPAALHRAAAGIQLCKTPQVGSSRVLRAEEILRRVDNTALLQSLSIPEMVIAHNPGWPVEVEAVRSAISYFLERQNWSREKIESAGLTFPSISAAERDPRLQVATAVRDHRSGTVEFRMRCSDRLACSSFVAILSLRSRDVAAPEFRVQDPTRRVDLSEAPQGAFLAQKAKLATLVLQGKGMQLSLPVICLDAGRLGQQIRVRDSKTGRVFTAEVTGVELLKAQL